MHKNQPEEMEKNNFYEFFLKTVIVCFSAYLKPIPDSRNRDLQALDVKFWELSAESFCGCFNYMYCGG